MKVSPIILGRSCGSCKLCCKVLSIVELQKPKDQWCRHCEIGRGCKIYEDRPDECRNFYCGYLTSPDLKDHWFPATSKLVVVSELDGARVAIHVDPGRPHAWREEPFYSEIKQLSEFGAEQNHQVVVTIARRAIVIFPDRDVDLGIIADDERIITRRSRSAAGIVLEALKLKADDPLIAGTEAGKPISVRKYSLPLLR